ncbi:hypothetical protein GMO_25280 [Gluconobacter morbifer G707]|uniref:Uncharacterized protein n=1 Tax=Gluconobacter morbifer G707 TaxID=1088869 RepID=G6XLA5_9PROT|nr:hypothetical protein GMO_25280 [Gluconobacter morbifer G707]
MHQIMLTKDLIQSFAAKWKQLMKGKAAFAQGPIHRIC